MKLKTLLENVTYDTKNYANIEVHYLCVDSRKVQKGSLFFCIEGGKVDGHNFVLEAISKGAVAVVVSHEIPIYDVPVILVDNVRKALTIICSNFYNNVDKKLRFIGITGTNGKTTTSFILKSILGTKYNVGVIGTSGCFIGNEKIETHLTTPDTLELFSLLYQMYNKGVVYVIMEVSAHAIALNKIYGLNFDIGIFTNLTHDHLDYFGDMENYWNVKKHFMMQYCKKIVVNIDDKYARELLDFSGIVYTYGLENPSDIFAVNINIDLDGSSFYVNLNDEIAKVHFGLAGIYNVYNVMAGLLVGSLCGVDLINAVKGVEKVTAVDGRFDLKSINDFYAIIDYAHSPDALENVLKTVRTFAKRRVIVVFGSSGYRDSLKRPKMGAVVSKYADFSVITSDNPRYENPMDIIRDIEKGYINDKYLTEPDRVKAVQKALSLAQKDDIVVICGKGHELGQNIMGVDVPYSDYDEVEKFAKNTP